MEFEEFKEFKEFEEFKNEASAPVAIRRPPMRGQHKVGVYLFLRDEIALPYVDAHGLRSAGYLKIAASRQGKCTHFPKALGCPPGFLNVKRFIMPIANR
jgi:hypothetical protein